MGHNNGWVLVVSNLFYLAPVVVAAQNFYSQYLYVLIYVMVIVASSQHHLCEEYGACFGVPGGARVLNLVDLFFAWYGILALIVLPLRIKEVFAFLFVQSLLAVALFCYLLEYQTDPSDLVIGVVVVATLVLYMATSAWRSYHPGIFFGGLAIFAVALLFYYTLDSNYVLSHSLWHFLTATAAFILLQTHPKTAKADKLAAEQWRRCDVFDTNNVLCERLSCFCCCGSGGGKRPRMGASAKTKRQQKTRSFVVSMDRFDAPLFERVPVARRRRKKTKDP